MRQTKQTKRKITANVVFRHLESDSNRIIIEQGGTRAGKTYNILLWLIFSYCSKNQNKIITICRKTFPSLRTSSMRDFIEILESNDLYDENNHDKSLNEYRLNNNTIEFVSIDQPQKIRGRKRNVLFINEANELSFEDWRQLSLRTTEKIILDFNPSMNRHWIYQNVKTRDDASFYVTTYRDNPFLEQSLIDEIERLKTTDVWHWNVYGLGMPAERPDSVFTFDVVDKIPERATLLGYGLDWGYSVDQTAIVAMYKNGDELYIDEKLHRSGMTNPEIANFIKQNLDLSNVIVADSSEPKSVEEIKRFGIKIISVGGKDTKLSIDLIRRFKLFITKDSKNLIRELDEYVYMTERTGELLNKPVDGNDHAVDAMRYAALKFLYTTKSGTYAIK